MDGVSSAASIVAIATAGLQISAKLVAFASDIKRASTHVNSLATDVSIVSSILHQLGELVEQKPDQGEVGIFSSHGLATTKASADVCKQIFTVIEEKLRSASKQARTGIKVGDRIELSPFEQARWPFLQPSIDLLRKDLQEAKGTLMLMLQVATLVSAIKALQSELLDLKLLSGANAQEVSHGSARPDIPIIQGPRDPLSDGTAGSPTSRELFVMPALSPKHDASSRDREIDLGTPNKGKMREKELLSMPHAHISPLAQTNVLKVSNHTSKRQSPRVSIGNDSNHHIPHLPSSNQEWPLSQALSSESTKPFRNLILFFKENGGKWLSVLLQNPTINGHLHLFMQVLDLKLKRSPVRPLFREVKICQQEIRAQLRFDQRQNRVSLAQILAMCTQEEHDVIDETLTALGSRASLVSIGRTIPNDNVESEHAQVLSVMHLIIRTFPVKESSVSGMEQPGRNYRKRMPLRSMSSTKISIGLFSKLRNLVKADHIPWGNSGERCQVHKQSSVRHYNPSLNTDGPSYSIKLDRTSSGDRPAYQRCANQRRRHSSQTIILPIPQDPRTSVRTPNEVMRDRGIREARKKAEDETKQAQIDSDQRRVQEQARPSQEEGSAAAGVVVDPGTGAEPEIYRRSGTRRSGVEELLSQPEFSRRPGEHVVSRDAYKARGIRSDEYIIPVDNAGEDSRSTTLPLRDRMNSERTTDPVSYRMPRQQAQAFSQKPEPRRSYDYAYFPTVDAFPSPSASYSGDVSTSLSAFNYPIRQSLRLAERLDTGAAEESRPGDIPVVHTRSSGPTAQSSKRLKRRSVALSKPIVRNFYGEESSQPKSSGPSDKTNRNPTQESETESFPNFTMPAPKQRANNDEVELATADIDTLLARFTTVFDTKP